MNSHVRVNFQYVFHNALLHTAVKFRSGRN